MYFNKHVPFSAYAASLQTAKFIAPTGSDANRGTIDSPWLTLAKLYQNLKAGQVGYARGGTYPAVQLDAYVVTSQGTASAPIRVTRYPNEIPIMQGGATTFNSLLFDNGAAYHILDGIEFENFICTTFGVIGWGQNGATVHDCYLTRCTIRARAGLTSNEHCTYISQNSQRIIIGGTAGRGNRFVSTYPTPTEGAGVEIYHAPTADNSSIVSWNAFENCWQGVEIANPAIYGTQIIHNTFKSCYNKVNASFHNTLLVRDNAGDATINTDLYDPDIPSQAFTTQSYNAWAGGASATFPPGIGVSTIGAGPTYALTAGPGIRGASDGLNCGWTPQVF